MGKPDLARTSCRNALLVALPRKTYYQKLSLPTVITHSDKTIMGNTRIYQALVKIISSFHDELIE
jgi:hypothetical protein